MSETRLPQQIYPKGHPDFLEDDTELWRYVSLPTLFMYLNGNVFLSSIANLRKNDPFEGIYPEGHDVRFATAFQRRYARCSPCLQRWIHKDLFTNQDKDLVAQERWSQDQALSIYARRFLEFLTKTRFVSCWFKSQGESALMWNTYGKGGAAIATTIGKLNQALATTGREFVFGQMHYIQSHKQPLFNLLSSPPREVDPLVRPHFLKKIEYKHEQEVRFVTAGPENEETGGLSLKVPAAAWIVKIRLWPKFNRIQEDSLKKTVQLLTDDSRFDCRCSHLQRRYGANEEWIEEGIDDLRSPEESRWRDGSDGVPREMKEL